MTTTLATPNSLNLYRKTKKKCGMLFDLKNIKQNIANQKKYLYHRSKRNQNIERKLREELEKYGEVKSINMGEQTI